MLGIQSNTEGIQVPYTQSGEKQADLKGDSTHLQLLLS